MRSIVRLCCAVAALLTCVAICSLEEARAQGTWANIPPMSTIRQIPMGGGVNNKFYVVGGYNGSTYVNTGEVYDPSTNAWTGIAPMPSTRAGAPEAVVGSKLYVMGGYAFPQPTHLGYQTTTIVYDPATNAWTSAAPLPINRSNAPAVPFNGKIYVLCGDNAGSPTNRVDIYDPTTNAWTTGANAPTNRDYPAAALLNGKIYVAGGFTTASSNTVDVYDPVANTWSTGTPMNTPREAPELQVIGGRLYATGGRNNASYLNTGEVYDPATNAWTAITTMSNPRAFFTSGVIGNRIYVAGGYSGISNLNTAEVFTALPASGNLLISEFRLYGAAGSTDEYVELYNNTDAPIYVGTSDGSAGYSVATALNQATSTTLFVIPNGTVIPARGHFLGVNSAGYSLGTYAASNATYTADTSPNVGLALFRTSNTANFSTTTRLDAVGSALETNTLYREGTGYAPLTFITNRQHAFLRDLSGGKPKDTQNNAADFVYVNTDGTDDGAGARVGAPGPENLASPIDRTAGIALPLLDSTKSSSASPNRERDTTSDPANNSTFGTMTVRKRIVNNTGAPITRLRFRVVIITGSPVQGATDADLRVRSSATTTVGGIADPATCSPSGTPCTVAVMGLTLESPSATNNGGLNSSLVLSAVTTAPESFEDGSIGIGGDDPRRGDGPPPSDSEDGGVLIGPPVDFDAGTLDAPLANGAALNVQFLFGVQKTGHYRFYVLVEALP